MVAVQVRALHDNWVESRKGHKQTDDQGRRVYAKGERLFLLHVVIVLARAPKSRTVDHAVMVMYEGERPELEIPDFALDKHTRRGRQRGRGTSTSSRRVRSSPGRRSPTRTPPRAARPARASGTDRGRCNHAAVRQRLRRWFRP
jgi:hypothetical protein